MTLIFNHYLLFFNITTVVVLCYSPIYALIYVFLLIIFLYFSNALKVRYLALLYLNTLALWYLLWCISVYNISEPLIVGNNNLTDCIVVLLEHHSLLLFPSLTYQTTIIMDSIAQFFSIEFCLNQNFLLAFLRLILKKTGCSEKEPISKKSWFSKKESEPVSNKDFNTCSNLLKKPSSNVFRHEVTLSTDKKRVIHAASIKVPFMESVNVCMAKGATKEDLKKYGKNKKEM